LFQSGALILNTVSGVYEISLFDAGLSELLPSAERPVIGDWSFRVVDGDYCIIAFIFNANSDFIADSYFISFIPGEAALVLYFFGAGDFGLLFDYYDLFIFDTYNINLNYNYKL